MKFLSAVLRFIVLTISYLAIGVGGIAGFLAGRESGELGIALLAAGGAVFMVATVFGALALMFRIHDHLEAIRNAVENGRLSVTPRGNLPASERVEPELFPRSSQPA